MAIDPNVNRFVTFVIILNTIALASEMLKMSEPLQHLIAKPQRGEGVVDCLVQNVVIIAEGFAHEL